MNNFPSFLQAVPDIHIMDADTGALFEDESLSNIIPDFGSEDTGFYPCSQGSQPGYLSPNPSPVDLEEISELSHLVTTGQFLTGHGFSLPYCIAQENGITASMTGGLLPSRLGSPIPSPTSSFDSSLSPASLHDCIALSDSEPLSPSPVTPSPQYPWGFNHQSSDSLVLQPFTGSLSNVSLVPSILGPQAGPVRPRSTSSPPRHSPVASKAMLEANSRRRRHPAQFVCSECDQTFTAQFSLKRHAQSHTGERPFECSIPGCKQRFFNSSDCKRHEKSKKRHKDLMML